MTKEQSPVGNDSAKRLTDRGAEHCCHYSLVAFTIDRDCRAVNVVKLPVISSGLQPPRNDFRRPFEDFTGTDLNTLRPPFERPARTDWKASSAPHCISQLLDTGPDNDDKLLVGTGPATTSSPWSLA